MALSFCKANLLSPPLSFSSSSFSSRPSAAVGAASNRRYPVLSLCSQRCVHIDICCPPSPASEEEPRRDGAPGFKDFPYASAPIRDLMVEVLSMVETRLGTELVPHTLPRDVEYYTNESGTNHGSLYFLAGAPSSRVGCIVGSWQHWERSDGGATDAMSLTCFMSLSTDAPSFTMELVQYSPTSLHFTLDLPPRRDLVVHHDYLDTFYIDTRLDRPRRVIMDTVPEISEYKTCRVCAHRIFSPTAIMACVDTADSESDDGGQKRLEEIVREVIAVEAKKVVETWLEVCACGEERPVTGEDRDDLRKRDLLLQAKIIENDILCRVNWLYGKEKTDRIRQALWCFVVERVWVICST